MRKTFAMILLALVASTSSPAYAAREVTLTPPPREIWGPGALCTNKKALVFLVEFFELLNRSRMRAPQSQKDWDWLFDTFNEKNQGIGVCKYRSWFVLDQYEGAAYVSTTGAIYETLELEVMWGAERTVGWGYRDTGFIFFPRP